MSSMLRLIAVVAKKESVGRRKLMPDYPYFFIQGFSFLDDQPGVIVYENASLVNDNIYWEYFRGEERFPSINISAIVGENGSGKSTVVEYVMRLINNFAASTLGETPQTYRSVEHIRFINGVYGSLYYQKDDAIWEILIENRKVSIRKYTKSSLDSNSRVLFKTDLNSPFWTSGEQLDAETPFMEWSGTQKITEIYEALFYTYISNYSIYAYNTSDYWEESNTYEYERRSRRLGSQNIRIPEEERNWLHGLFHKNDGYQCPIVLSPYRKEGDIDINNENYLSKERLISLLITSPDGFSIINGHLKAVTFTLKKSNVVYDAAYLKRGRGDYKLYTHIDKIGWDKFRSLIPKYWAEVYALNNLESFRDRPFFEYALDYLTYKTLKIAAKYKQYNRFYREHRSIKRKVDEKLLKSAVVQMSIDHSHITRKIRQILAYIEYGTYVVESGETLIVDIKKDVANIVERIGACERRKEETGIGKRYLRYYDELVPPPIFETEINLIDTDTGKDVKFETLSSGERQQAYTVSAMLYHLVNLESIFKDSNKSRITYTHVNVIMEELELYFHPELQKNLVLFLLDGIRQVRLTDIKAINICLVTHSPFVLSDIQSSNILALEKKGTIKDGLCTFGANIHDLLKTSFLHESVIGDYAQWMINRLIICLQVYRYAKEGKWNHSLGKEYYFLRPYLLYNSSAERKKKLSVDMEKFSGDFGQDRLYNWVLLIDEPLIRHSLMGEFERLFGELSVEKQIQKLQKELEQLKQLKA